MGWRAALAAMVWMVVGCGPKTSNARMKDSERRADQVNRSLDQAQDAETRLEPKDAESALEDAKKGLMDPDINIYPELDLMVDRYKELQAKLDAVRAERTKRDLDQKLNKARDKVVPAVQKLSEATDKLSATAPTQEQIEAVEDPAKDVRDGVDDAKDLFVRDPDFALWAKSQRAKAEKALEEVARAKAKLKLIEGPGGAWLEAQKLIKDARSGLKPDEQQDKLTAAKGRLEACIKDGNALRADPALPAEKVKVGNGPPQTPAQLVAGCRCRARGRCQPGQGRPDAGEEEQVEEVILSGRGRALPSGPGCARDRRSGRRCRRCGSGSSALRAGLP